MTKQAANFIGDIPAKYDYGLGLHLLADYGVDLARRVAAAKPGRVLEIAAGTGIVTRLLRDALPPSAHLVASDLNLPMLEIAREKFGDTEQVEFRQADATALPFADGAFDAVGCQFGLMFFTDKSKAYREAFRVLAPSGRYYFNVWDSFEFNSFARITHEVVGRFFGQNAPAFFTVPFGYHRIDAIKTSLIQVGFADISIQVVRIDKKIEDVRRLAEGLIFGNPIVAEIGARDTGDPAAIADAVTTALRVEFSQNARRLTLQAIIFDAWKPRGAAGHLIHPSNAPGGIESWLRR
ncbi:MAG TPA: methyltransferase domain-containing protein [Xanthobacteraceae bacterium]|jgi:ubiquinone/menaquinone biosynthesis C-methylase UbiE